MGAAVHPQVCTVDVPYHAPTEKVTDDVVVISYHNDGDRSAIDALLLPCRGLPKQPAATVLGLPDEDAIDQSADNALPILCDDHGDKSERDVLVDNISAVPSSDPGHQSAGDTVLIPHHNPDDQSADEAAVAPCNGPNHQAADDGHLVRSLTPGGQVAEPNFVTPHHDSEDKYAEIPSHHDPGHQPADDTHLISNHHREGEEISEDKPADDGLRVSQQDRVDQLSDDAFVISCHKLENPPVTEVLQIRDSVSRITPDNDDRLVTFQDPGPKAPDEALICSHHCAEVKPGIHVLTGSGNNSGDQRSGDASLAFDHELELSPEDDNLLVTRNDTEKKSAENTCIESFHDSERKIAEEISVLNKSEDTPTGYVFAVSKDELRGKGEDDSVLATIDKLEDHHPSDAEVFSYVSAHKHTDETVPTSNHGSGRPCGNEVHQALPHHPEVQPPDHALLASPRDLGDQLVDESLVISSHDSGEPPAKDALLIISNALNEQPAGGAHSALSNGSDDHPADDLLVVSPYAFAPHLLRLETVSKPNQLLARALTQMRAVRDDYATAAYIESFNWSAIVDSLTILSEKAAYKWQPEVFYIVVFRSRVRPVTNRVDLGLMDAKAHEEAMQSGGLLKYWFGVPDANCRNLATCKFSRRPLLT